MDVCCWWVPKTRSPTTLKEGNFSKNQNDWKVSGLGKRRGRLNPSIIACEPLLTRHWYHSTQSDITAQVKAKKEMRAQGLGPTTLTVSERLRLESERDQAAALGNLELVAQLTRQLEQASGPSFKTDSLMSQLNERNRKANREEIRRAELAASELRRQQMKALESGAAVKLDPSARVKINPKLTYEARSVMINFSLMFYFLITSSQSQTN